MLIRSAWLVVLVWLALCVFVQLHFAWSWVAEPTNPLRHELRIGLAMATLHALPAVVGLALLRWRWWPESAPLARRVGPALVVALATLFVLSLVVSKS
jgi:hypothetical protein